MDLPGTIHLLGDLLGQVITEQESPALFETEERVRAQAKARRAGEPGAAAALAREPWRRLLRCTSTWSTWPRSATGCGRYVTASASWPWPRSPSHWPPPSGKS